MAHRCRYSDVDGTSIARVEVADILPLRQAVLRPTLSPQESVYAEDHAPSTVHLAVLTDDATVVACVTVFPSPLDDAPEAWRLRGMATDPTVRGTGVGGRLLAVAIAAVEGAGGHVLWCNAREPAEGFYARYGFEPIGELFEVPPLGPHRFMRRRLLPAG